MKKYLGIFELFIKSTFYKLLPVFIVSGVIQTVLFKKTLDTSNWNGAALGFEYHIDKSGVAFVFAAAFVAVCVILCLCGCEFSSRSGYTLRRLGITEKKIMLCEAIYNSMVFVLLVALQILMCIIFFKMYVSFYADKEAENFITQQTLLLAFYRNDFLSGLFPLEDYLKAARNIVFVLGLGFVTAAFPFLQRRRKFCAETIVLAVTVILFFNRSYMEISRIVFPMVLTILVCFICFVRTVKRKDVDGYDAKT